MKKHRFLTLILAIILAFTCFTACSKTNNDPIVPESKYKINVPTDRQTAIVGKYELPSYNVMDEYLWLTDYVVSIKSVKDPSGNDVTVTNGSINATAVGVYKITYSAEFVGDGEGEVVSDAVLEVDFTKPKSLVIADFNNEAENIGLFNCWAKYRDDAQKYGDALGSLKIAYKATGDAYVRIEKPEVTDVSAYDYFEFYVYNESSTQVQVGLSHCGFTWCQPNEWTQIKINFADIGVKTHDTGTLWDFQTFPPELEWTGIISDFTDITHFAVRVRGGFPVNGSIYVSSITVNCN